MNVSFDSFHHRLDATIIGVMATDPGTEYIHCLDGSIVVCDSVEAMHHWLQAHVSPLNSRWLLYGRRCV